MRDATGRRLTLDELAAVIDPPSEGSQLPPGIRQYLRILEIYGDRSALSRVLDTTTDAAGVQRALDELPEVDALDALAANAALVSLLTGHRWFVMRDAREDGATWEEIGAALGMTKQGAQDFYRRRIEEYEHAR